MADTRNDCQIVNKYSEVVEKQLAEAVEELEAEISEKASINDTTASSTSTYSSTKIEDLINNIPVPTVDVIDDSTVSLAKTFSSSKIVDLLMSVLSGESKYITINTSIGRVTASYATVLTISDLNLTSTSKGAMKLNYTVTAGSTHPAKEILISGVKSDNSTYVISDTTVEASSTSTQSATINLPEMEFEDDTKQILIQIKNVTNDQYSATFNFTGFLNTLAL